MRHVGISGLAATLAAIGLGPVHAAGYDEGAAAYRRHDYQQSYRKLKSLAETGDARAQYILGRQFQFGQGVKSDKAEAYYWYRRAEAGGHVEAKLFRHLLETHWNITADERNRGERKLAGGARNVVAKADAKPAVEPAAFVKPETTTVLARAVDAKAATGTAPSLKTEKVSILARAADNKAAEIAATGPSRLASIGYIEGSANRASTTRRELPPSSEARSENTESEDEDETESAPAMTTSQPTRRASAPPSHDQRLPEMPPPTYGYRAAPPNWGPPAYAYMAPSIAYLYPQPIYYYGYANYYRYAYHHPSNRYWHPGWRRHAYLRYYNY